MIRPEPIDALPDGNRINVCPRSFTTTLTSFSKRLPRSSLRVRHGEIEEGELNAYTTGQFGSDWPRISRGA
jgi:hypothetical protein